MLRVVLRTSHKLPSCWLIWVCLCKKKWSAGRTAWAADGVSPWYWRRKGHIQIYHFSHFDIKAQESEDRLRPAATCLVPLQPHVTSLKLGWTQYIIVLWRSQWVWRRAAQLLGQQHAQCAWKALAPLPARLSGSWKVRHATTSRAFLSSPTTFSTTFAAERRPGGYSSSCRPPGDKDTTALFIAFVSYPLNPKYRFPLQLSAPALCPFPAPCWSSPALAAVIVIPVKRSGVNQTVSFPQKKKSIFQVLETKHNSGQVRLS